MCPVCLLGSQAHLVFCTKSSNTWVPLEYHLPLPKFMKIKTYKNHSYRSNMFHIKTSQKALLRLQDALELAQTCAASLLPTKVLRQGWNKLCKMWCHGSVRMTTRPYPHLAEDHFVRNWLSYWTCWTVGIAFLGCLGSLESWNSGRKGLRSVTLLLGSILLVNSNWKINMEDKVS